MTHAAILVLAFSPPLFAVAVRLVARHRREVREQAERDCREWDEWMGAMTREMQRYVTIPEAAAMVGRKSPTMYGWVRRDKIRAVRQGNQLRVRVADVYRAEHGVRGKGRPPVSGRLA